MSQQTTAAAYDTALDRGVRKTNGVYYTPAPIVDEMIEKTLGPRLAQCSSVEETLRLKLCDPACGAGAFLLAAFRRICARLSQLGHELTPELRADVQRRCLFGSDIDGDALAIARSELPWAVLSQEDFLAENVSRGPFDVLIGNPPYGAKTDHQGESTRLFIDGALASLARGGAHAFIVPKALLHSSTWRATLERLLPGLVELVDCGKVWREVKLEQVIYFYRDPREFPSPTYRSCLRDEQGVHFLGALEKVSYEEFGFALNGVSEDELRLARRLRASGLFFGQFSTNVRGRPCRLRL